MKEYIKEPHTTIFTGPTSCGKTHLVLDLIEKEYIKHFDYTIIICPTLWWNKTYHSKGWIKNDKVWLIEPKDKLYQWIEKLPQLLAPSETLFITNDIISHEGLDKRRQSLLELAISGRHCDHHLWLLRQSHSAIPKNLRRQAKVIFVWYPQKRTDLKMIHDENNVLTDDELVVVRDFLKKLPHACPYIRNEYLCKFKIVGLHIKSILCYPKGVEHFKTLLH